MSESNWDASRECLRRAKEARYFIDAPTTTLTERADLLEAERRWIWRAQKYSLQGGQPSNGLQRTTMAGKPQAVRASFFDWRKGDATGFKSAPACDGMRRRLIVRRDDE